MGVRGRTLMNEVSPDDFLGTLTDVERRNALEVIFVAGDVDVLCASVRVSEVGSRRASVSGLELTTRYAERLVERGIPVVSGLAVGVANRIPVQVLARDDRGVGSAGAGMTH